MIDGIAIRSLREEIPLREDEEDEDLSQRHGDMQRFMYTAIVFGSVTT